MGPTPWADATFLVVIAFIVAAATLANAQGAPSPDRRRVVLRSLSVAILWLTITALPTLTGLMGPSGRIPPQLFMFFVLTAAVAVSLSGTGRRIAGTVPLWALVGFQGFRLPLELVLHRWAEVGVAPPQMTWTGQNPDIISGVVALLAIPIVRRKPVAGWVPTVVGVALLLNIGRIVATSLPGPLLRFPDLLTLPMRFPHVWIGSVCVAAALAAHILAIRALRAS